MSCPCWILPHNYHGHCGCLCHGPAPSDYIGDHRAPEDAATAVRRLSGELHDAVITHAQIAEAASRRIHDRICGVAS